MILVCLIKKTGKNTVFKIIQCNLECIPTLNGRIRSCIVSGQIIYIFVDNEQPISIINCDENFALYKVSFSRK